MRTISYLSLLAVSLLSGSSPALADYQPYRFKCVYDASNDGMITATSKLDPDSDDWTFLLKSSLQDETEELEAKDVFVMGKDEKIPDNTARIIRRFVSELKIDQQSWFTTSEVILVDEAFKMSFFKFNSEDGTLGIGVYSLVAGSEYFTECKSVR